MTAPSLIEALGDGTVSPRRRYMQMFVGEESWGALARYELLTGLLGPMPGALGFFLRARLYRHLLRKVGPGTVLGRNVTLRAPGRIAFGAHNLVDDGVVLDAKGDGSSIELGDHILIGRHTILSCNQAVITAGDYLSIGPFCFFACKGRIDIGSNVAIGSGSHIMAGGHATDDPDVPIVRQPRVAKGIIIEDGVWIGSGTVVLDGVRIGTGSIVGAGSVVSRDVPPWTLVLGNPARVVQKRREDAPA